jgi:hypothetical protein
LSECDERRAAKRRFERDHRCIEAETLGRKERRERDRETGRVGEGGEKRREEKGKEEPSSVEWGLIGQKREEGRAAG